MISRHMPLRKCGNSNTLNSKRISDNIRKAFMNRKFKQSYSLKNDSDTNNTDMHFNDYVESYYPLDIVSKNSNRSMHDPFAIMSDKENYE